MPINIANWDRWLRTLSGTFLMAWGIAGGPVWMFVGLYPIATAAANFCPLYAIFGFKTFVAPSSKTFTSKAAKRR